MGSRTPEDRERFQQLLESGRAARANMQAIIERSQARRAAEEATRERRHQLLRRLLPFRRAA
jgi:DNA-binding MarR family transcriptional regulator